MTTYMKMSSRGDWLVTKGGSSSARYAQVISRHLSYEAAERRARVERHRMFQAGDTKTRCGVEMVDTFVREGGVLVRHAAIAEAAKSVA